MSHEQNPIAVSELHKEPVAVSEYEHYTKWKKWSLDFSCSERDGFYFDREFGAMIGPGQRIIEIGFGNGGFLCWARQRGCEVYGVEIQQSIVAAANAQGFFAVSEIDELLPKRQDGFDAVVALDVFEHIPPEKIPSILASVETLLKPFGTLVLRVPNGLSPFSRHYQYGDGTHINVVTPAKVTQWCIGTKLRVVDVRNEARARTQPGLIHRLGKMIQFGLREFINRAIAAIYGLPYSKLDVNLVIRLKKSD